MLKVPNLKKTACGFLNSQVLVCRDLLYLVSCEEILSRLECNSENKKFNVGLSIILPQGYIKNRNIEYANFFMYL